MEPSPNSSMWTAKPSPQDTETSLVRCGPCEEAERNISAMFLVFSLPWVSGHCLHTFLIYSLYPKKEAHLINSWAMLFKRLSLDLITKRPAVDKNVKSTNNRINFFLKDQSNILAICSKRLEIIKSNRYQWKLPRELLKGEFRKRREPKKGWVNGPGVKKRSGGLTPKTRSVLSSWPLFHFNRAPHNLPHVKPTPQLPGRTPPWRSRKYREAAAQWFQICP